MIKFLFKFLFFIIILAVIALGGVFAFAYFKYDVNAFKAIGEIKELNQEIDESALVTNGYTEEDYVSYNNITTLLSGTTIRVRDRQIAAFVDKEYGDDINEKLPEYVTGKLLELSFSKIDNKKKELNEIKLVFKIDLTEFKENKLKSFPVSAIAGYVPNYLYVEELIEVKFENDQYNLVSHSIMFNEVVDDSELFKIIGIFADITKEGLSEDIAKAVFGAFFGDDGVLDKLRIKGMTDYRFEKTENNELVIFTVLTSATYSINYVGLKGESTNPTTYKITDLLIELENSEVPGYEFLGFFDQLSGGNKVTTIDALEMKNIVLYARYELIDYTIELDLNGGSFIGSGATSYQYNVESAPITLPTNIQKVVNDVTLPFKGWTGTDLEAPTLVVTITTGSTGNRVYVARYEGESVSVSIKTKGNNLINNFGIDAGSTLSNDLLNEKLGESFRGYKSTGWYQDQALSQSYDFSKGVAEDLVLYTDLEYIVDEMHFMKYQDKFDQGLANKNLVIDSEEELNSYIYYVVFKEITSDDEAYFTISYKEADINLLNSAVQNYMNNYHMGINLKFQMAQTGDQLSVYLGSKYSNLELLVADPEGEHINPQTDYALKSTFASTRTAESKLAIDRIEKTFEVSCSDQLYYVVMNGYRPTFADADSAVAKLYQQARELLISICDDTLSDIEKLHNIYEYLALNVNYDHYAANNITADNSYKYDSWKLEGVFNSKKAVCEGYAKSLALLANMENIPTVVVTGDQHAWNRSLVDGKWYVIDATHADFACNGKEVFTNTQFMITDALKESLRGTADAGGYGVHSDDFKEFVAETEFNYFEESEPNGISLDIRHLTDFAPVINYLKTYGQSGQTVEVYTTEAQATAFYQAAKLAGLNFEPSYIPIEAYSKDAVVHEYIIK